MDKTKRLPVDNLLRGISTHHAQTVRDAWRELLEQGEDSVASVRSKLTTAKWGDPPKGPMSRYLGILLAVLHELDPDAFRQELEKLLNSKLHPINRKTVLLLSKRSADKPAAHVGAGVPVYVAADVADRDMVVENLERWVRTPGVSLDRVTRINVIAHSDQDYVGQYNILTSSITLTWPAGPLHGISGWAQTGKAEGTFYHEVGHHVLGHVEGGQVEEQEKEADDFARSMMRKSHPALALTVKYLIRPVAWILRPLFPQKKQPNE